MLIIPHTLPCEYVVDTTIRDRFAIVCHQRKAIGFTPEQNIRVVCSAFWSTGIADAPYYQVGLMPDQLGTQCGGNVLV